MYHRHSVRCVEKNNSHILMMMSPGITLSSSSVGVITRANIQELRIIGRVSISQSSSVISDHSGSLEYSTLFISKRSEVVKSEHSIGDDARLQIYSKLEKRQHICIYNPSTSVSSYPRPFVEFSVEFQFEFISNLDYNLILFVWRRRMRIFA